MMPLGVRSNTCAMASHDRGLGDGRRAEGVNGDRHRLGDTDRVRQLHLAPAREPCGDDVLRNPARGVARRPIDLRRILATECAAAVAAHATVRIDNDLASGEPGIALRSADDEAPGRD